MTKESIMTANLEGYRFRGPFHKSSYERFLLYEFVEPVLKAPSHLTECRRTKGYEWEKCTKCTRIQRIQTEFPSNHAISNYCQLLSTNGKQRKNITCE